MTSLEFVSDTGLDSRNGKKRQISLKDAMRRNALFPTPDTNNHRDGSKLRKDNNMMEGGRHGVSLHHLAAHQLIPTPRSAMTGHVSLSRLKDKERNLETVLSRIMHPTPTSSMLTTQDFVQAKYAFKSRPDYKHSLLQPGLGSTPAARDWKGANSMKHLSRESEGNSHHDQLPNFVKLATGTTGQLNHQFTLEMMGFPPDWVTAAFSSTPKPLRHPSGRQTQGGWKAG